MEIRSSYKQRRPPLRAVREAHGLGLRETAELAKIDAGHLSRVERGQARLSLRALARLAQVLGLKELSKLLSPYTSERAPARGKKFGGQHNETRTRQGSRRAPGKRRED